MPPSYLLQPLTYDPGRSLNSSKLAFDDMNRTVFYQLPAPTSYTQQAPQTQLPPAAIPRKRQLAGSEVQTPSFTAIQPKPPGLSPAPYTPVPAEQAGSFRPSPGDSAGEPVKKRRGRPSNAQIEQEKAAAAAEGREWHPRPPRPPRKKKSNTTGESPPRSTASSQQIVPQTPEIQMAEQEETSSSKKRRRKAPEGSAVVRPAPYDPVRPSPSDPIPYPREGLLATPQPPSQGPLQLGTIANLNPEYHHPTTEPQTYNDNPQQMQTEQ